MNKVYSAEDLKNFILESKPDEGNIIEGYPFSGKKHLLYEVLNNFDVTSFSIIYHKNILLDKNQKEELKKIMDKTGIDAYKFEDFDKIKDKIKGEIVFLLLPSKIFIDDNKDINNEEKKFKDAIEEIKKNHILINVTRDCMYNYLFENRKGLDSSNLKSRIKRESIIKKVEISFENLKNHLKKTDKSNIPEEYKHIVKVLFNKDGANVMVNNLKMPDGTPVSYDMKKKILRHAKINYGPYRNYYFPGLLIEGVNKIGYINNEKIDDIEEFEKDLAVESSIFTAIGISTSNSLDELTYDTIENGIKKVLKGLGAIISSILPGVASFGAGLAGAFLSILFMNSKKSSNFGGEMVKWSSLWKNMPQERKEYIAYQYDILYNLTPGESFDVFNNIFGVELSNLKKQIELMLERLESLEMRGLEPIINEKELKNVFPEGTIVDENLIVGLDNSDESKFVREDASNIIKNSENNNITFITGEPGAGKSTMLYITGRMLLNNGKKICRIKDLGLASFEFATTISLEDYYILFDINDIQTAKAFNDRINQIIDPNYSKVIVSVRRAYIGSYINPNTVTKYENYPIKHNNEIISSIAVERISRLDFLTNGEQEEYISTLVTKAERVPLYISEAVKYINNQKSNCKMLALPTGIKKLTKFILKEEYKRDKKNIIVYNLVALYSYAPKRLIDISCSILGINDENLPQYFDKASFKYYHLHSWYREILENLDIKELGGNSDNLPNLPGLNNTLEEVNDRLNSIEDDRLNGVKNDLNQFLYSIKLGASFTDNLRDITDALLLASLIGYASRYLKATGQKHGYNIIREDIDYSKLSTGESLESYYEISIFTLTQLFSNVTEDDFNERPILPLIVLYSSRFYRNYFSLIIRKLVSGKKPYINEDSLLNLVLNEEYPFINYIHAASYWLCCINVINSLTNGGFFILIGKFYKAAKEFDKAIKLNPNNPIYHNIKGSILFYMGNYQEALNEFDNAIKLNTNNPLYYNNKGEILDHLGRYKEALDEYNKAIKLDSNNPIYHYGKGIILSKFRDYLGALDEYNKAMELDPNKPLYHNNKGIIFYSLKNYLGALDEYNKAMELDPNKPLYHNNKSSALIQLGNYQEALNEFDNAIQLNSYSPLYHHNKGGLLIYMGKYREALDEYNKAIKLNSNNPIYYFDKGCVLFDMRSYKEALNEFDNAIQLNSSEPVYRCYKGIVLFDMRSYKDALNEFDNAIQLNSSEPYYYYEKGNALYKLGNYQKALDEYNKAIKLDPTDPDYHDHKGDTLSKLGKKDEALAEYKKARILRNM